jgi:hypothetical protein
MLIIGVDYHPSDEYVAFADTETGECGDRAGAPRLRGWPLAQGRAGCAPMFVVILMRICAPVRWAVFVR